MMSSRLFQYVFLLCSPLLLSCGSSVKTVSHNDREARLIRFGTEINSAHDDFAPLLLPDGYTLLYTTNRPHGKKDDGNFDVYQSRRSDEQWQHAERLDLSGSADLNEGALAYDHARSQVYFQQCFLPGGYGDCDIYVTEIEEGKFVGVKNAGQHINSPEWDAHPSITRDGNTLYFSSERFNGRGGADIWISYRQEDGTWGSPLNLGQQINTKGDEKSPFISADGKVLFFASNYLDGFGGFDIFRAEKTDKGWTTPINMGKPYNTEDDDLFFATSASEDTAFFSSNRKGSLGGLDVYEVIRLALPPPPLPPAELKPLVLRVTVLNEFTLKPVTASLILSLKDTNDINIETDENGKAGHEIEPGAVYTVTALSPGFMTNTETVISDKDASGEIRKQILLKPIRENERIIYAFRVEFDFDRFNIRPEERRHLDSAAVLLAKYPKSTVVVAGHTDSVGTVQYNVILSYNRAARVGEYVKSFLESKNVKLMHALEIRSYGKAQPIETNDTPEGRQRNRRVEISIVRDE